MKHRYGENFEIQYKNLLRQLLLLRAAVAGLALVWLAATTWLVTRTPSLPPVLALERLDIVESDGSPAIVLANSQRPIAATIDGQQISGGQEEDRRGLPSIIFFDGKGDEVGGMLFGTTETPDGYQAGRHLSFDAYKQDQTVVLAHYEDPDGAKSGLFVNDAPEHSLLDTPTLLGLEPAASKAQINAAIEAIPEDERESRLRELFITRRAFFGSSPGGEALLELRDGQGRVRVVIEAPETGEPSIRFLSETGETMLRLPE
jgi:hypothetical protein